MSYSTEYQRGYDDAIKDAIEIVLSAQHYRRDNPDATTDETVRACGQTVANLRERRGVS